MSAIANPTSLKVALLNGAGIGDVTWIAAAPGKRFVLYHLYLETGAGSDVTFKSGTNAITGVVNVSTTLELKNAGVPVFLTTNINEAFVVNVAAAVDADGWAIYGEIDS